MLFERYHTLVKLYSHDNPSPGILDRRRSEFRSLFVGGLAGSPTRHLQFSAFEWRSGHDINSASDPSG